MVSLAAAWGREGVGGMAEGAVGAGGALVREGSGEERDRRPGGRDVGKRITTAMGTRAADSGDELLLHGNTQD
jgi:hypothetical protein